MIREANHSAAVGMTEFRERNRSAKALLHCFGHEWTRALPAIGFFESLVTQKPNGS
jgi:hypothetical protein